VPALTEEPQGAMRTTGREGLLQVSIPAYEKVAFSPCCLTEIFKVNWYKFIITFESKRKCCFGNASKTSQYFLCLSVLFAKPIGKS
jgi:hypothetical protein